MKKFYSIVIIIAAMVVATSSCARRANAQESVAENVAQVNDSTPSEAPVSNIDEGTPTEYTDTIGGRVYTIFLSKKGKAFVWKTKKATGEKYKQYRPEKGKQINPEAYK